MPSDYLGTLKTAIRMFPKLCVPSKVPTEIRLRPFKTTSRQPLPLVILARLSAFSP